MRRTWAGFAAVSLCLMLAGFPAEAQSPPPAQSPPAPVLASPSLVRYEDPVGDTQDGIGPDIVAVTVSQPDPASVSISVEFAAAPPLGYDVAAGWTDMLMVMIATSPEGVVALPGGGVTADFFTGLHGANLQEMVEQGAPLSVAGTEEIEMGAVRVTVDGATTTLTLTRESLGDPERIFFAMGTAQEGPGDQPTGGDAFPDSPGEGPHTQVAWTFATE